MLQDLELIVLGTGHLSRIMQTSTKLVEVCVVNNGTVNQCLDTLEGIMSNHPKVPATSANCEEDHEAKLKLNEEFEKFKEVVENAAKISPDVQKLKVPLKKLENAVIIAAHGRYLVPVKVEKKQRA